MRNFDLINKLPLAQLIIILIGAAIYLNTLQVPFYLDDYRNIVENSALQLRGLTAEDILKAGLKSPLPNRAIANITFALNYFFHKNEVAGYHIVNMVIHISAGLFLFLLIRATFATPVLKGRYPAHQEIAFWVAVLWLVHPVQTQSVTYIVQRMNSLAAMFYILAFLLYAKGRFAGNIRQAIAWYTGCLASWLLAMGSKEIAATLPFLLYFYEWIFFQHGESKWIRKQLPYLLGLGAVLFVLLLIYLGTEPWDFILRGYEFRHFSLQERVFTQFRVIFFYISLLLLPFPGRLGLEHDFAVSASLVQPVGTLLAFCGITLMLVYAIFAARRRPLVSFSIIWFFANLAIESSIIPLELVFEHRLYLPSMFFFLPICTFILQNREKQLQATAFLAFLLILFGGATYARNNDWRDPVVFWNKNLRIAARSERVHSNLGLELMDRQRLEEAISHFNEALQLNPFFPPAYNNIGLAYMRQGRLPQAADNFQKALSYNPDIFEAQLNLGGIYGEMGNLQGGLVHLQEALRIDPTSAAAHNNLGNLLVMAGRYAEAVQHYDEALRYNPDYEDARFNRQIALKKLKQKQ